MPARSRTSSLVTSTLRRRFDEFLADYIGKLKRDDATRLKIQGIRDEVLRNPAVSIYADAWGREGDVGVVGLLGERGRRGSETGGGVREHADADLHGVTALRVEGIRGRMAAAGSRGAGAVAEHGPAATSVPHYCAGAPARVRAPAICEGLRT